MASSIFPASLSVRLARDERDLIGAQHLRYQVFVTEMGGDGALVDHDTRREADHFDPFADHLLLIDADRPASDQVVGVYRLMTGAQAERAGGFYSAAEFDLDPLLHSGRRLLELGRSCLHPAYRGGAGMFLLWQTLAEHVTRLGCDVLFGVASFAGADPAGLAQPLALLHRDFLAPEDLRVRSWQPGPSELGLGDTIDRRAALAILPPLIRAYLRLGGKVGEGCFVDHAFNTTDICMILDLATMTPAQRAIYEGRGR